MMTKQQLFKRDIPIISLASAIAFIVPNPIDPGTMGQHLSGIALGFAFAWLLKFSIDLKKIKGESAQ